MLLPLPPSPEGCAEVKLSSRVDERLRPQHAISNGVDTVLKMEAFLDQESLLFCFVYTSSNKAALLAAARVK